MCYSQALNPDFSTKYRSVSHLWLTIGRLDIRPCIGLYLSEKVVHVLNTLWPQHHPSAKPPSRSRGRNIVTPSKHTIHLDVLVFSANPHNDRVSLARTYICWDTTATTLTPVLSLHVVTQSKTSDSTLHDTISPRHTVLVPQTFKKLIAGHLVGPVPLLIHFGEDQT